MSMDSGVVIESGKASSSKRKKLVKITASEIVLILSASLVVGCATSMTPSEFNETMPRATRTRFYERVSLSSGISDGQCHVLVANRKYTARVATTVSGDVKNAARGIDAWVKSDGGNGYSIGNYEWIHVGSDGTTQLIVNFDTLRCY